ncbi:glycosyltransferase [Verrucomicrobiaceae bacterium 227]
MLKVDVVTDTYAPDVNGVAMTLGRLVDGLREKGHQVHVIHTAGPGSDQQETNFHGVALPGYREVRVGLPKPLKFKKRWKMRRPDVVYIATESPMGGSAVKACRKLQIPVVMGFHTNFDQYLTRYRLEGMRPLAISYLRKIHARADRTLVPTLDVRGRLEEVGFKNVELMGRGVDTALFSPAKRSQTLRACWGTGVSAPVGMVVGRVAAEKNLEVAMRAFERMKELVPDFCAVVVGDGPARKSLQLRYPWVQFVGVKEGDELATHYASADILLFPSETETFGNVTLEGMASGLITVGYDYAAAKTHVRHGANGLKAAYGDEEAFIRQCEISLSSDRWMSLREQARTDALDLSWDRIIGCFESHLLDVIPSEREVQDLQVPRDAKGRSYFRTVFLSDIHLGTPESKTEELCHFLRSVRCRTLVLNGDIVDGWALQRGSKWLPGHTKVIRTILKKLEKENLRVIYLRGNHDDILERFLPLEIGGLEVMKEYFHTGTDGRKYLVIHGDGFDQVATNHAWLAKVGAIGYDWLLKFNRSYNWYRKKTGREYFSLSKAVKARVKATVSFVGRYQEQLQELAKSRNCDGIICGHIHTPANEMVGEIHYLNSGDWVESLTGVVELENGEFHVLSYDEFLKMSQESSLKESSEERVVLSA